MFREGDCYGRVVNVAARVMDHAKPGAVLITQEVVSASKDETVRHEEFGLVSLKGVTAHVTLWLASAV